MSNLSAMKEFYRKEQHIMENYTTLNLLIAKQLASGEYIYHRTLTNWDGSPQRFKVLSVKTWKTRPYNVLVSVKRGVNEFHKINQDELKDFMIHNPSH